MRWLPGLLQRWLERRARRAAAPPVGVCASPAHAHNRRSLTLYSPHPRQSDCFRWEAL